MNTPHDASLRTPTAEIVASHARPHSSGRVARPRLSTVFAAVLLLTTTFAWSSPVAAAAIAPDQLKVNFQPVGAPTPDTYQADTGDGYDSARGYGWAADDGADRQCAQRDTRAQDRVDTFCHATTRYVVESGHWTPHWSPAVWRADLRPGTYDVTVTIGDTGYHHPEVLHAVQANGIALVDPTPTSPGSMTVTTTERITVMSGLELTFWGGNDTKINSVKAIPVATPAIEDDRVKVNFQPANASTHRGYEVDAGAAYDAERGYGWHLPDGHARQCADRHQRDNQRLDTNCRATTRWTADAGLIHSPASWSAAAANGTYDVTITVGDVGTSNSSLVHSTQINGTVVHDRVETTNADPTDERTVRIEVLDEHLHLTFEGGSDTRVMSFKAVPVAAAPTTTSPVAPTTTAIAPTTTAGPTTTVAEPTTTTTAPMQVTTTTTQGPAAPAAPNIAVWDGLVRRIGDAGVPQRFVNVLGNVTDDGVVEQMVAVVNDDAPRELRLGAADRRLARAGDFNLDIPTDRLVTGTNRVVLIASDDDGNTSTVEVFIILSRPDVTESAAIDWSQTRSLDDVALAVDGDWRLTADGLRTAAPGYDRLVAIGDIEWESYEATTSIVVHGFTPDQFDSPSYGAGVGVFMHWTGHSENPGGRDPLVGFLPDGNGNVPFGALAWIRWEADGDSFARLLDSTTARRRTTGYQVDIGEEHLIKVQVENGPNPRYRWRIWPADEPEPTSWQTMRLNGAPAPASGSLALVAHEADASFGDVVITPLG